MPEGDTLFRTAVQLRKRILNGWIEVAHSSRFEFADMAREIESHQIVDVESRGKHLLIHLDDRSVIHSHLGMTGSWHFYQAGDAWKKPAKRSALTMQVAHRSRQETTSSKLPSEMPEGTPSEKTFGDDSDSAAEIANAAQAVSNDDSSDAATRGGWIRRTQVSPQRQTKWGTGPATQAAKKNDAWTIVCFSPKLLERLTYDQLRRHRWLHRLGPDLLSSSFDVDIACRRVRESGAVPIGEAVMNQSIACGIGNVYKSEVLFQLGINPFIKTDRLADEVIRAVYLKAQEQLAQNLSGYPRRTRHRLSGSRHWAYGREGEPCYQCGEKIQLRRQGDLGRSTYWCPRCQPSPDAADSFFALSNFHRPV